MRRCQISRKFLRDPSHGKPLFFLLPEGRNARINEAHGERNRPRRERLSAKYSNARVHSKWCSDSVRAYHSSLYFKLLCACIILYHPCISTVSVMRAKLLVRALCQRNRRCVFYVYFLIDLIDQINSRH